MLNLINRFRKTIGSIITQSLNVALPSSDEQALGGYNIVPLVGQSSAKSGFQKELESAHREGSWKPKLLLLPDVGKFEIKLSAYNAALLANGILTRYPSEITLFRNRNRRMNRYLVYSYWRLYKHLNSKTFWSISINLIRNSSVYLSVCMHSVNKNIYRELRQRDLKKLIMRINELRANYSFKESLWCDNQDPLKAMRHYVRFYRVYIPKGVNSVRPLGVPTKAWRIYQKMWLIPIMGYTSHLIPDSFHGYIPGRGTGTAWRKILLEVIHSSSIFEVDFKQFFPSVPTSELTYFLYQIGRIPLSVCVFIHYMNNSIPMFQEEPKLKEVHFHPGHEASLVLDQLKLKLSKPIAAEKLLDGISTTGLREPGSTLQSSNFGMEGSAATRLTQTQRPYAYLQPHLVPGLQPSKLTDTRATGRQLRSELEAALPRYVDLDLYPVRYDLNFEIMKWKGARGILPNGALTNLQRSEMWKELEHKALTAESQYAKFLLGSQVEFGKGLPQGATLSPFLSILYLEFVLKKIGLPEDVRYLFYADDGLFYSDNHSSLSSWINKISGHKALPTSISHYGIQIHKEKSSWVKILGTWKHPLKFLGLKFLPGATLAESILMASTRGKIHLSEAGFVTKASQLKFDKYLLVAYDYMKSLMLQPSVIQARYDSSKTYSVKYYYQALMTLSKLEPVIVDYLYLVFRVLSAGIAPMILFFNSKIYLLRDALVLREAIQFIFSDSSSRSVIELSTLDPQDKEKVFKTINWLKGGYENSFIQPSASQSLLSKLEKGYSSISLIDLPFVRTESQLSNQLIKIMAAPMLFDRLEWLKDRSLWILRKVGEPKGLFTFTSQKYVPLDLYRFLITLLLPLFSIIVPPLPWVSLAKSATHYENGKGLGHFQKIFLDLREYYLQNQFRNLANSKHFGLIMSRMYIGSYTLDDLEQSFDFTFEQDSLAEYLLDQDTDHSMNVFVGSSYAFHEVTRLTSHLKRSSRTRMPFKLFKEGFLLATAWESPLGNSISLATPSLAQEFPGGQEPNWSA